MVKPRASVPLALLAPLVLLAGCAGRHLVELHPETLRFGPETSGGAVSLVAAGDALLGVFADRSTASLEEVRVPVAPHLPSDLAPHLVDVVDFAPPLSAAFGRHALAAAAGSVGLLYEDRVAPDRTVLKLATRPFTDDQWTVDVLEPAGDPVAILPSPAGGFDAFWESGGLLRRSAPGGSLPVLTSFAAAAPSQGSDPGGFTAFNQLDGSLSAIARAADGFVVQRYAGPGPVQASLFAAGGGLSVMSWDPGSRRIQLTDIDGSGKASPPSTVTLSNDTTHVQILPGPTPSTRLFLFDESRPQRPGAEVSVIAPAAAFGLPGARYRKAALLESDGPIEAFAGVATPDALYVLVQSGGMTLVRAAVRGASPSVNSR
jgi:hypothetical protein